MASVTWLCPRCGRRVPNRALVCHCGMTQEEAQRAAPVAAAPRAAARPRRGLGLDWGAIWRDLTWDMKALAIGVLLVAVLGLVWLFVPRRPERIVPVLGIVAPAPSPSPTPKPTPRPTAKPKRRWLPW